MAVARSDFNETEDFEEYNPHPYQGGYDIALTYGNPLPPSSEICYPLSDAFSNPPEAPIVSVPMESPASPEAEYDLAEADYGSSNGFGERGFASADWWWNLSGFSPFAMNGFGGLRYDAEDMGYWRQLRRAADYIFGYSEGFGERRIGVDSYGIPIYAYRHHGSDAVNVEIQPARTEKLEYRDDSERWSSSSNNWKGEKCRLDSSIHHSEASFDAEVDPVEPLFSWKLNHDEVYDDQLYHERKWGSLTYGESMNEVSLHENLEIAYDKHYYRGAQNVQLEAIESSFQKLTYHEASEEISFADSNWEPSYSIHGDERNTFTSAYHDYERQDYQQPNDVELEPYKSTWAQYPGYYGISEEDVCAGFQPISDYPEVYNESSSFRSAWPTSSFGERSDGDLFHRSEYPYQTHQDDDSHELEPFKPSWMLNPSYYGSYEDISATYKQDDE